VELSSETERALERGGELHDTGRYFEAHEAWEEAWRLERGDARELLQGLIQVATALHHGLVRRRVSGARRLLESGLERLLPLGSEAGGIDLERFRAEVALALEAARRWERGEEDGIPPVLAPRVGALRKPGRT